MTAATSGWATAMEALIAARHVEFSPHASGELRRLGTSAAPIAAVIDRLAELLPGC